MKEEIKEVKPTVYVDGNIEDEGEVQEVPELDRVNEQGVEDGLLGEGRVDKIAEAHRVLSTKYAETALLGLLSSNVMKYSTIGEMTEDIKNIVDCSMRIGDALADEVLK